MMHDGGKATIHIVARDPDVRRGLIRLVEGAGWHTVAAERFPEDFESCVATRPGCLVLDASRFAANRFELQQLMRSPTMFPVIAISQPVDLSIAVEAMKDGVFHFMERPFRDRELLDRIHAAVRRDTDHRQALAHHAERALRHGSDLPLRNYDRWRRAEFAAKWRVESLVARVVASPWLLERAARGFAAKPELAHMLIGVTGDFVPAREVLRPRYVAQLMLAAFAGPAPAVPDVTHA